MKQTNKILAVVLSLVLVIGSLAACQTTETPSLQSDNYIANVEIKFASNDDVMKVAIDAMGTSKSTVYVSGDEMRIETSGGVNGVSLKDNYIYFLGVLYHEQTISNGEDSITSLEMANVGETERAELVSNVGAGVSIDVDDFDNVIQEGTISRCTDIKSEAKVSLQKIFASNFADFDATVELTGAEYELETESGRDKSSTLSCHFSIDMNGKVYEITMHISTTYDYDASFAIAAPFNVDEYVLVNYDEIIK